MAKKIKNQGTQKVVKIIEASNVSPPYEISSSMSNTNDTKGKKRQDDSHVCKCNDKTQTPKPKTWESITKLYGNTNTTVVWDDQVQGQKRIMKSKPKKKENYKLKESSKQDDKIEMQMTDLKLPKKRKSTKKSVISFYRNKNKNKKQSKNQKLNNDEVENKKKDSPVIQFQVTKRTAKRHDGTGDSCIGGPCTRGLENINNQVRKTFISKDKRDYSNFSRKDQVLKKETEPRKYIFSKNSRTIFQNFLSKCSFIRNFSKHSCFNKQHNIDEKAKGEPMFEMKVDSVDMRVLNTSEIKEKVKTLGTIDQNRSCICPSRLKSIKNGRHNVCPKGACESALENKQIRFNCKCRGKSNLVVCKDTTCGLKVKKNKKRKKCKLCKSLKHENDVSKAAFEVILDRTNMNILNTQEVDRVLRKASSNEICPTGICNVASKDPNVKLKCSCIGKKIVPRTTECTDKTCTRTVKKCKLSNICSRIFSKSENTIDSNKNNLQDRKTKPTLSQKNNKQDMKRQNLKARSDTHDKKVRVQESQKLKKKEEEGHETFCECDIKVKSNRKKEKKKENKKTSTKNKQKGKRTLSRMKCKSSKRKFKQNRPSNLKEYIVMCLQRKRVRCKKQLKKEEKEFKRNEKKAIKENLKIQKMIEKKNKIEEPYWNCLTKFVSGILNLGINIIKKMFSTVFSLIFNPIRSFVYVRERAKDPPGTLNKIFNWFYRMWSNKTTKLSQNVKESETMNIIADQIEDSAFYDTLFANKGRTKEEKSLYERKKRIRKRRIMKRHDEALYGCRHMLLTTMRKTPHLWFYHLCPDLYPQCLSLVTFMTSFFHIIIYLLAFVCWTPCIVSFELCRAFLCCFLCTG